MAYVFVIQKKGVKVKKIVEIFFIYMRKIINVRMIVNVMDKEFATATISVKIVKKLWLRI